MAKKVTVTLIDDLDQEATADETVEFGLDGVQYEIDLSSDNAAKLRDELAEWVSHARRVTGRKRTRAAGAPSASRGKATSAADRETTAAIREWARENNLAVSARGRISAEVIEAYNAAH
ncbi:Lsr2 family protein [Rhodococcus rhodnii]|uniref:LSR2 protein n=2 Tax=Rhodococcus rhodnii TaxID=38312 RepID=R7WJ38_9NOCA|nr:Lsr2 family protein [Rhodococcus rhodnii]EOM75248.1 LSR2 protein precursor [Rhodococcus rhodnii LMG 5362]TXG89265.1 Lsr2 family protein [Rhodococcus rhodnii]